MPIGGIRKKIIQLSSLVAFIIGFGTVGYMGLEGWSFWDSLYMTTITLTTVGYREIHPLSFKGILFTMILMVGGEFGRKTSPRRCQPGRFALSYRRASNGETILKPTVVDFVEFATRSGNIELQMWEILIQEKSDLIGQTLAECAIGRDLGVIIVAIKQSTGETKFNMTFRRLSALETS